MQTIIASHTGADSEEALTSDVEVGGIPLLFQHYNLNNEKKKAIAGISQESLFKRPDGGWIKTSAPMFDKHLTNDGNYRDQENQRCQGALTLVGGAWTADAFDVTLGDLINGTAFDATSGEFVPTGEEYTTGQGNLRRVLYSLTAVLGFGHLEDTPVTINSVGTAYSAFDPDVAEGVVFGFTVTTEGDLTDAFLEADVLVRFEEAFNSQAVEAIGSECEPRYGTCLRADSVFLPFPAISYYTLQVLVVTDLAVEITASDGTVTRGRQGYSLHSTFQGGDFAVLAGAESVFDHSFALAYMLNTDCQNSYIYSKSASNSDHDAGYDSSAKTGCEFVDSNFVYVPNMQKADASSFGYAYLPYAHHQNFFSALDTLPETIFHSNEGRITEANPAWLRYDFAGEINANQAVNGFTMTTLISDMTLPGDGGATTFKFQGGNEVGSGGNWGIWYDLHVAEDDPLWPDEPCADSTEWRDFWARPCQWYLGHDPGCAIYVDRGQRENCPIGAQ